MGGPLLVEGRLGHIPSGQYHTLTPIPHVIHVNGSHPSFTTPLTNMSTNPSTYFLLSGLRHQCTSSNGRQIHFNKFFSK